MGRDLGQTLLPSRCLKLTPLRKMNRNEQNAAAHEGRPERPDSCLSFPSIFAKEIRVLGAI